MTAKRQILVIRFSAMGDVAMTVPVIKSLIEQNPDAFVTFASRPDYVEFFKGIPRLTFFPTDLAYQYKGFKGLLKLFKDIKKKTKCRLIADLHDNLRTKILRNLFRFSGINYKVIDKGRTEKKLLTRFPDKVLKPLRSTTERYADVFRALGFTITLDHQLIKPPMVFDKQLTAIIGQKTKHWVGVAPFAKHLGKILPLKKTEDVIASLNEKNITIFLFGGSLLEEEICLEWAKKYKNVISLVRRLTMEQEFLLIRQLDVMMAMDSAGMHLASIEGVPVVSVWGSTHHYAGFLGYGQSENNIVADDIICRPCSIYGNKPCFRKDYACLNNIDPIVIVNKINEFIDNNNVS